MVRIKDVAEKAGVSISTVSYVINNKGDQLRIAAGTQKKVWDAVRELGYHTNTHARNLKKGIKCNPVYAVLWNNLVNSNLLERFMSGVHKYILDTGNEFELVIYPYQSETLPKICKRVQEDSINGAIWLGAGRNDTAYAEQRSYPVPIVVIGPAEKFSSIGIDQKEVGRTAANHMFACGCRNVALIPNIRDFDYMKERTDSFVTFFESHGGKAFILENQYDYSLEGGMLATSDAFHKDPSCDGLYYMVDIMAAGCINWLNCNKRNPMHKVQVMSHGNSVFAQCAYPKITVTDFPVEEMTVKALQVLNHCLQKDNHIEHLIVPCPIIERGSCSSSFHLT